MGVVVKVAIYVSWEAFEHRVFSVFLLERERKREGVLDTRNQGFFT